MRLRSAGSDARRCIASASAPLSPGGTRIPASGVSRSGEPPTLVVMIGNPCAIASITLFDVPSANDGRTNTSSVRMNALQPTAPLYEPTNSHDPLSCTHARALLLPALPGRCPLNAPTRAGDSVATAPSHLPGQTVLCLLRFGPRIR